MKIAIVGATGTAGTRTTAVATSRGHEAVEISRASGVDLHTGAGLTDALAGVEAVIDTSNPVPTSATDDVVGAMSGATRLVEACSAAGVEHLVFLSISNIDKPELDPFPYFLRSANRNGSFATATWRRPSFARPSGTNSLPTRQWLWRPTTR